MKKIILAFVAIFCATCTYAQTQSALRDSTVTAAADSVTYANIDSLDEYTRHIVDSLSKLDIWKDYSLEEIVVKALAPRVMVKEDTIIYNASQFKTPEGSVIEELVAKLPGAEVSDEGTVKINGKTVKKILVDGKEFMTGDTKTALKNLPTSIIDKIKTYDQKSDMARVTGIEDGEEETVLDFGIKKGMNKGTLLNADLAIGTDDRFAERLFAGYFQDKHKLMLMGNANNTNDRGMSGGGGGGFGRGNGTGDNIAKMLGLNYNFDSSKFKMDASVRWEHKDGKTVKESWTESFMAKNGKYTDSNSSNRSRSNSWNGQMRIEWTPWENTNIMFRPNISYSTNDGTSGSWSKSYNSKDPDNEDPVNEKTSAGLTYSENTNMNAVLQINQKLNDRGRNITFRARGAYTDGESLSMSTSDVELFKVMKFDNSADSTYHTYRYNSTPTKKYSYFAQLTYSEPIYDKTYLQFSYRYTYNFNKSDRSTFDFSNIYNLNYSGIIPTYRQWDDYLGRIDNYTSYRDDSLSRYSEYSNYINEFNLTFRMIRTKYQLNVGVMLQPQKTDFMQDYRGVKVDTTRTVFNVSPTLDFRYNFSKQHRLRMSYRGSTDQPSMSDLLDITDNSNPLNIKKGNPGLKPSFTQSLNAFYNNYITDHQQAIMGNVRFSTTRNSISDMVTYDDLTGGQTTKPENINGKWNINAGAMYNTSIDSAGVWFTNTHFDIGYNNRVGYLQLNKNENSQKNTTRTTTISPRLGFGYRNDWLEIELNGNLRYERTRNLLQATNNMDTKDWNLGASIQITAPWGTSLTTNILQRMRKGYLSEQMNTNELIWNAQASQSFLKGKNLVLSVQFYDILHQQSNISRTITAMQQSESLTNNLLSYGMVHLIYRFNAFGGKQARQSRGGNMSPDGGNERPSRGGSGGGFGGGGRPQRM